MCGRRGAATQFASPFDYHFPGWRCAAHSRPSLKSNKKTRVRIKGGRNGVVVAAVGPKHILRMHTQTHSRRASISGAPLRAHVFWATWCTTNSPTNHPLPRPFPGRADSRISPTPPRHAACNCKMRPSDRHTITHARTHAHANHSHCARIQYVRVKIDGRKRGAA